MIENLWGRGGVFMCVDSIISPTKTKKNYVSENIKLNNVMLPSGKNFLLPQSYVRFGNLFLTEYQSDIHFNFNICLFTSAVNHYLGAIQTPNHAFSKITLLAKLVFITNNYIASQMLRWNQVFIQ